MTIILADFAKLKPYLGGNSFSSDLVAHYGRAGQTRYRNDILIQACTGKNVLHIGCCDHVPLIARKWHGREWLHGQLTAVAESVLGVDIDVAAVSETRRITGLPDIIAGDVTSNTAIAAIAERYFDIALFGEVVEHIGDPVRFLKQFLSTYERNVRDVIITVPNAFRAGNVKGIFANREVINSDHRFFFTPYTICKVACDAGIAPSSIQMASFSRQGPIKKLITSRWPLLAENIVLTGKPSHRDN
jgi:hypothetical protein